MTKFELKNGLNVAKVWFLFGAGLFFYGAFMALMEYWKKVGGLHQATIFLNTSVSASFSAGIIAAGIVVRYFRRHRSEIRKINSVMPAHLIVESGLHTGIVVGSSNAVYTNTGWAVTAGSGLLKGLALQFSALVDNILVKAGLKKAPDPTKRQLDTWALRVALIGIALIVWGKLDLSKHSSRMGMLIVLVCAFIYAGSYARRQYLAGRYRVLINRLIEELQLTTDEAKVFSAIAEKWWFALEQLACMLCVGVICSGFAALYAYAWGQAKYLYFAPWVFLSGIPFGLMSYFAVMIMVSDYRLPGEDQPASMKARMVMTKGQGIVASLIGPIPVILYFGLDWPEWKVIAGSLVVLFAVVIPYLPDFASRTLAQLKRLRRSSTPATAING